MNMYEDGLEGEEYDGLQHFQLNVIILEARHLSMINSDTKVVVSVGKRNKVLRSKTTKTDSPYFNELCIFNFYLPLSVLLDEILKIKLYGVPKLKRNRLVGSFSVELATIWFQPNHQFYHKWAALTDPNNPAGGVKGYLKCDIALLSQGTRSKPTDRDPAENIEDHMLVPFGEISDRQRARFVFSLFRADNFSYYFSSDPWRTLYAYVRVTYAGLTGKTTVVSGTFNPSWNQELAFDDMIPALCQYVHIEVCDALKTTSKGILGSATLDLRKLSHENGFLPTYGPSFLYLYQNFAKLDKHNKCAFVSSSFTYMCRLLMALRTEVVDYAEDVLAKKKSTPAIKPKSIPPLDESKYFKYSEFIFFAAVFDVLLFDASIVTNKVSFRVNIGPDKPAASDDIFRSTVNIKPSLRKVSEDEDEDGRSSNRTKKTVTFEDEQSNKSETLIKGIKGDKGGRASDDNDKKSSDEGSGKHKLNFKDLKSKGLKYFHIRASHENDKKSSDEDSGKHKLSFKDLKSKGLKHLHITGGQGEHGPRKLDKRKIYNDTRNWKPLRQLRYWPNEFHGKRKSGSDGEAVPEKKSFKRMKTENLIKYFKPHQKLNIFKKGDHQEGKKEGTSLDEGHSPKELDSGVGGITRGSGSSVISIVAPVFVTGTRNNEIYSETPTLDRKLSLPEEISQKKEKFDFSEKLPLSRGRHLKETLQKRFKVKQAKKEGNSQTPSEVSTHEDENGTNGADTFFKGFFNRVETVACGWTEARKNSDQPGSQSDTESAIKRLGRKLKWKRTNTRKSKAWKVKNLGSWTAEGKTNEISDTGISSESEKDSLINCKMKLFKKWSEEWKRKRRERLEQASSASGTTGSIKSKLREWRRHASDIDWSAIRKGRKFCESDGSERRKFDRIKKAVTSPRDWKITKKRKYLRYWPKDWETVKKALSSRAAGNKRKSLRRIGLIHLRKECFKKPVIKKEEKNISSGTEEKTELPSTSQAEEEEPESVTISSYDIGEIFFEPGRCAERSGSQEAIWSQKTIWQEEPTNEELSYDSLLERGQKEWQRIKSSTDFSGEFHEIPETDSKTRLNEINYEKNGDIIIIKKESSSSMNESDTSTASSYLEPHFEDRKNLHSSGSSPSKKKVQFTDELARVTSESETLSSSSDEFLNDTSEKKKDLGGKKKNLAVVPESETDDKKSSEEDNKYIFSPKNTTDKNVQIYFALKKKFPKVSFPPRTSILAYYAKTETANKFTFFKKKRNLEKVFQLLLSENENDRRGEESKRELERKLKMQRFLLEEREQPHMKRTLIYKRKKMEDGSETDEEHTSDYDIEETRKDYTFNYVDGNDFPDLDEKDKITSNVSERKTKKDLPKPERMNTIEIRGNDKKKGNDFQTEELETKPIHKKKVTLQSKTDLFELNKSSSFNRKYGKREAIDDLQEGSSGWEESEYEEESKRKDKFEPKKEKTSTWKELQKPETEPKETKKSEEFLHEVTTKDKSVDNFDKGQKKISRTKEVLEGGFSGWVQGEDEESKKKDNKFETSTWKELQKPQTEPKETKKSEQFPHEVTTKDKSTENFDKGQKKISRTKEVLDFSRWEEGEDEGSKRKDKFEPKKEKTFTWKELQKPQAEPKETKKSEEFLHEVTTKDKSMDNFDKSQKKISRTKEVLDFSRWEEGKDEEESKRKDNIIVPKKEKTPTWKELQMPQAEPKETKKSEEFPHEVTTKDKSTENFDKGQKKISRTKEVLEEDENESDMEHKIRKDWSLMSLKESFREKKSNYKIIPLTYPEENKRHEDLNDLSEHDIHQLQGVDDQLRSKDQRKGSQSRERMVEYKDDEIKDSKKRGMFWSKKPREASIIKLDQPREPSVQDIPDSSEPGIVRANEEKHVRIYNGCNTTVSKSVTVRQNYGFANFSGSYPCLHLNGEWPDALRRLYRSNIVQKSVIKFKEGLAEVENDMTSENRMEASEKLKKVYTALSEDCQNILRLTSKIEPEDTNLYRERKRHYHGELKEIIEKADTASKKKLLIAEDELKRAYTYLTTLVRYAQDPEDAFPDTEIWLMKDGKSVAQHRMKTQKIVFSPDVNERGIHSGKIQSIIARGREGQEVAKIDIFMWFGLGNHFAECKKLLPQGFQSEPHKCPGTVVWDVPLLLSYTEEHYFQCQIHLFQARILLGTDVSGLADPFVRATVLSQFKESQIQKETLNPTWDETLVFPKLMIHGPANYIKKNSVTITIEVIDYDFMSKNELIGRALLKPVVWLHDDEYKPPKLMWEEIRKECSETGRILVAAEMREVSKDDPEEPRKQEKVPIPESVRPVSVGHRLEVLFWGVRELRRKSTRTMKVFVTLECGGKYLTSPVLKNANKNLNFPGTVQTLDLELPEDQEYKPPLIMKLFQTGTFVLGRETYSGNCIIPSVKAFFSAAVDDVEKKKNEISFKELLAEAKQAKQAEEEEALALEKAKRRKNKWRRLKIKIKAILESFLAFFVKIFKRIKCKIKRSCVDIDRINLIDYEEDESLDWWVKYYASREHKRDSRDTETLVIYEEELEAQPEFRGFSDFIYTFDLVTGKGKKGSGNQISVGKVKAAIKLYRWPLEDGSHHTLCGVDIRKGVLKQLPSNVSIKYVARVYVVCCKNLTPKDLYGKSDPYLILQIGNQRINDEKNYIPKQVNPIFGKCFEFKGTFPKEHLLRIKVMDHDIFSEDDLIGETLIDLESRYYTKHHASCGLPKTYSRTGYTAWRDAYRPTEILKTVCKQSNLEDPVYTDQSVRIGEYEFQGVITHTKHQMEMHALAALKKWHEIPLHGFHLVPEHVETRALYHPSFPDVEQGKIEMWIDIFPADFRYVPPIVDIEPRKPVAMELRAIVWNVEGVILDDTTLLFNEKMSDIYVQGWLNALENDKQVTDVHYRSMNGEGNFNWRFIFPFKYIASERRLVVFKKQTVFDTEPEEMKFPCKLELQVWDNDFFSDDFLGSLNLELCSMPRGAKISTTCKLSMFEETTPKINLFKIRRTRGWWPFSHLHDNASLYSLIHVHVPCAQIHHCKPTSGVLGQFGKVPLQELVTCRKLLNPPRNLIHIVVDTSRELQSSTVKECLQVYYSLISKTNTRIVDAESSEYSLTGKIDLELEVMTEKEAKENPVGKAREEPKALPPPKRPESSFIWFLNPFKTFKYIICKKYGKALIIALIIAMLITFLLLGIYSFPGYTVKRILGA